MPDPIVTRARLQNALDSGADDVTWTTEEETLQDEILDEVSRLIEDYCSKFRRRHFYQVSETRYFTAEYGDVLYVDDLVSIDANGLKTDHNGDRTYERTWTTDDFDLEPYNAAAFSKPYEVIRVTPMGTERFPVGVRKGVEIAGTWGWPAVPGRAASACLMEALRRLKHFESPSSSVVASPELGKFVFEPTLHPTTKARLMQLKRVGFS